jgi:colicin import membrane protein
LIRDKHNIIPVFLAGIFHVLIFGGLVVAIDFSRPAYPAVPLAITATLIAEADLPKPPPVEEPEPEPEPEPDTSVEDRAREEEAKRQADMREEQQRIRLEEEADRKRRLEEEAERKRQREKEVERLRAEAERKRLEDIERQQLENRRLRMVAEEAELLRQRQVELDAEDMRLAALSATDEARWVFALQQQIARNFVLPASAPEDLECVVNIRQLPGGQVVSVEVGRCNGGESVRRAIEAAVNKASPLPSPDNPGVFDRDLRITFKPEQ